jgi:hypothetical protein
MLLEDANLSGSWSLNLAIGTVLALWAVLVNCRCAALVL